MTEPTLIDSSWIAANPVPVHGQGTTKNSRGRVLVLGGSCTVPGAVRLTGEAALRVGAGKLQMATVGSAAVMLGLLVPEAATIALPEDAGGEIGEPLPERLEEALNTCDVLIVGPGIGDPAVAERLLRAIVTRPRADMWLVIDAMAIGCVRAMRDALAPFAGRLIFTPHFGEMAVLVDRDAAEIADDPSHFATHVAAEYEAITVLKDSRTVIATPDGELLLYSGGGTGLATGGSGDVLAGAIGGLLSRGAEPLAAAGWGVWLHGQSGRRVATTRGPIGFLAREIPAEFPRLLPQ